MRTGAVALAVLAWRACAASLAAPAPRRTGLRGLRAAAREAYREQERGMAIRRRKRAGEALDFANYHALAQANADLGRLVNLVWLGLYFKQWTPLAVLASVRYEWFPFPLALPSAFETEQLRLRTRRQAAQRRAQALRGLVEKAERRGNLQKASPREPAAHEDLRPVCAVGLAALAQGSKAAALKELVGRGAAFRSLKDLPDLVLYGASAALEGPFRVLPKFMHRGAIETKIKAIHDGDDALRRSSLPKLSTEALQYACEERALPSAAAAAADGADSLNSSSSNPKARRDAMQRDLGEWLSLAKAHPNANPAAVTLALLAINTASNLRRDDATRLSRALLANGF